ncbi:hypothetical protein GCM10008944_01680 [Cytobacillus oceanisediminis]
MAMAWTDPSTWVAGAILTAQKLNEQVRDNLKAIGDPWQTYAPTWSSSGTNPSVGNGSLSGAFSQAGKQVNFRAQITIGSTTTFGSGVYSIGLPVVAMATRWIFTGAIREASPLVTYAAFGETAGGSSAALRVLPTTPGGPLTGLSQGTPITLSSGDVIAIAGSYEAA